MLKNFDANKINTAHALVYPLKISVGFAGFETPESPRQDRIPQLERSGIRRGF